MDKLSDPQIEKLVLATVLLHLIAFLSTCLNKRFQNKGLKYAIWACYMSVPVLVAYTMGLMGETRKSDEFPLLYIIWGGILLFTYSSSDTLNVFTLDEANNRLNLVIQLMTKMALLSSFYSFTLTSYLHLNRLGRLIKTSFVVSVFLFVMMVRFFARLSSMGHACGATPYIREMMKRIIDHMNEAELADPVNMKEVKYLVGQSRFPVDFEEIGNGTTVEKIWGCAGKVLRSGDPDGQLKDTCLASALFWLLLGKIWAYPLYEEGGRSKVNAWKLVHDDLLAKGSAHERVFKVIEVELSFLQDYFYTNYLFLYQTGWFMKLCTILAFPPSCWWLTMKGLGYKDLSSIDTVHHGLYTKTMIVPLFAVEVMQLFLYSVSRWCVVSLLCTYADRETLSKNSLCVENVVGAICRISLFTNKRLFRPWKGNLDQYSLLQSCNSFGLLFKELYPWRTVAPVLGIPFLRQGRKLGSSVVLSENVKRAVVQSLCTNSTTDSCPKLSDGGTSILRNGVSDSFSWAFKHRKNSEIILLWHIATGICEMNPACQQERMGMQLQENFEVATTLSKYCAYLLFTAPLLLPVPAAQADFMCDAVIKEARRVLLKPMIADEKLSKYEILVEECRLSFDHENSTPSLLHEGVKLGLDLQQVVEDEGRRWKILAELWAEMILFLAPSNSNEMVHAKMLADGGEFITHLWALLIHAGILDREDLTS